MTKKTKVLIGLGFGLCAATLAGVVVYLYTEKEFDNDYESVSFQERFTQHAEFSNFPRL